MLRLSLRTARPRVTSGPRPQVARRGLKANPQTQPRHHLDPVLFPDFPTEVPSLGQRLKPLIPFLIYWSAITSLAVHLLRARKAAESETAHAAAQESVLEGLIERFEAGEVVSDTEIRRELEMVGLRERTDLTRGVDAELSELGDVSMWEVVLGRRKKSSGDNDVVDAADAEDKAVEEWTKIVKEAADAAAVSPPPSQLSQIPERTGTVKRAASANVYM